MTDESTAKLPLIAAAWYEHLTFDNAYLGQVMTKAEYVEAFCRMHMHEVIITSAAGTADVPLEGQCQAKKG